MDTIVVITTIIMPVRFAGDAGTHLYNVNLPFKSVLRVETPAAAAGPLLNLIYKVLRFRKTAERKPYDSRENRLRRSIRYTVL